MLYVILALLIVAFAQAFFIYKIFIKNKSLSADVENKNKRMVDMDSKFSQIESERHKFQFENTKLHSELSACRETIQTFETEFSEPVSLMVIIKSKQEEIAKLEQCRLEKIAKLEQDSLGVSNQIESLKSDYASKKQIYDNLKKKIALYDEDLGLLEMGFYKPHFDFGTSEIYKVKINEVRAKQKEMLKSKKAVLCTTEWTIGNSKAEGKKFSDRAVRLAARAFNSECDAIVANVRWNNVEKMQQRMQKAFDDINTLNIPSAIIINYSYLNLKLSELWLAYEYQEKIKAEKEEQAEIRRQIREEAKLEQEVLAAQKEEEKYQKLLLKAQREAEKSVGGDLDKLNAEIAELSAKLEEAHQKNERALSMAQQTRAGHVYVISNVGSFGEEIYKIGMTRRLEPMDRVKELGDASVPFYFDVHAMIYSDDAPAMENALHRAFADRRLNLVNLRKEFFNVALDEIRAEVHKISSDAEFVLTIEAQEYYQSQMIRKERGVIVESYDDVPESI